uniref:hypothetical protein n=1 Tax=Acetivibrio cellulolyticus TaxID=35830 RepID=UPI0002481BB6|nr:hypothetical protein [Acetivibrio cellulolyticus]
MYLKVQVQYNLDTVYLSYIHSYYEYTKDGVRYLISGGAGAELLTKNSYYHYLIARTDYADRITRVQLPSPANNYIARYSATVKLFAKAMYEENPVAVVFIIAAFILLILLLVVKVYIRRKQPLDTFGRWLGDIGKYAVKRFRELFCKKST